MWDEIIRTDNIACSRPWVRSSGRITSPVVGMGQIIRTDYTSSGRSGHPWGFVGWRRRPGAGVVHTGKSRQRPWTAAQVGGSDSDRNRAAWLLGRLTGVLRQSVLMASCSAAIRNEEGGIQQSATPATSKLARPVDRAAPECHPYSQTAGQNSAGSSPRFMPAAGAMNPPPPGGMCQWHRLWDLAAQPPAASPPAPPAPPPRPAHARADAPHDPRRGGGGRPALGRAAGADCAVGSA